MGAAAEGSPACARGATRALCVGNVSIPRGHRGPGSRRAGLCCHLPSAHGSLFWDQGLEGRTHRHSLIIGSGPDGGDSWVKMGFSGPQLPLLLGELRPASPGPPQLSATVVATTGAAALDPTAAPVCTASWGLSVREVPSWAWGRGLGGWRGASWQPLRCSRALGSSSWPPCCCL